MAVCRCGCGRTMGMMERRVSGRACYVASFIPALHELERCIAARGEDSLVVHDSIRNGHDIATNLLDEVHHANQYTRNTPKYIGDWETKALSVCWDVRTLSPSWFAQWPGPSNKGPLVADWFITPSPSVPYMLEADRVGRPSGAGRVRRRSCVGLGAREIRYRAQQPHGRPRSAHGPQRRRLATAMASGRQEAEGTSTSSGGVTGCRMNFHLHKDVAEEV